MSRGVRRNALLKASERHRNECSGLHSVNDRFFGVDTASVDFPE